MNSTNHKTMLSEHFDQEEFTYSRIAVENALDNTPPAEAKKSLQHLVTFLLEPLRKLYKAPIAILSGYRSEEVNRMAGGVATSQHRKGEAADCYVAEGPEKLLSVLRRSGLVFDQAILYKRRGFLHLSLKLTGKNRMQVIFCLLCVVCVFSGCGTRRRYSGMRTEKYTDSIQVSLRDSSVRLGYSSIRDSLSWELNRIVYSPPDSCGVQYIRSVTTAKTQRLRAREDSVMAVISNRHDSVSQSRNSLSVQSYAQVTRRVPLPLIIASSLLLALCVYFFYRRLRR